MSVDFALRGVNFGRFVNGSRDVGYLRLTNTTYYYYYHRDISYITRDHSSTANSPRHLEHPTNSRSWRSEACLVRSPISKPDDIVKSTTTLYKISFEYINSHQRSARLKSIASITLWPRHDIASMFSLFPANLVRPLTSVWSSPLNLAFTYLKEISACVSRTTCLIHTPCLEFFEPAPASRTLLESKKSGPSRRAPPRRIMEPIDRME